MWLRQHLKFWTHDICSPLLSKSRICIVSQYYVHVTQLWMLATRCLSSHFCLLRGSCVWFSGLVRLSSWPPLLRHEVVALCHGQAAATRIQEQTYDVRFCSAVDYKRCKLYIEPYLPSLLRVLPTTQYGMLSSDTSTELADVATGGCCLQSLGSTSRQSWLQWVPVIYIVNSLIRHILNFRLFFSVHVMIVTQLIADDRRKARVTMLICLPLEDHLLRLLASRRKRDLLAQESLSGVRILELMLVISQVRCINYWTTRLSWVNHFWIFFY